MARMHDDEELVVEDSLYIVSQSAGVYVALVAVILLTIGVDESDCCPSSEMSHSSVVDTLMGSFDEMRREMDKMRDKMHKEMDKMRREMDKMHRQMDKMLRDLDFATAYLEPENDIPTVEHMNIVMMGKKTRAWRGPFSH